MDTALPTMGLLFWRWIEFYGLDAKVLFQQQGLTFQDIQSHRERIAIDRMEKIILEALVLIEDKCSGLNASRCWHPSDLGALGYAWLASSTISSALRRMERYSGIVGEKSNVTVQDTEKGLKVSFQQKPRDSLVRDLVADFIMSIALDMCRFSFGASLRPIEVSLERERPGCAERYLEFYGCDLCFSARNDSYTLAADDANQQLPTSNKQLAGLHDQVLTQQLASLRREDIATRCKAIIMGNLTTGNISIDDVARELHMSARTLTRRLESQDTSLKTLVDEVRSELASRYLADPAHSITEVAFLLGFSQSSSLTRASNRWFGVSPIKYRSRAMRG